MFRNVLTESFVHQTVEETEEDIKTHSLSRSLSDLCEEFKLMNSDILEKHTDIHLDFNNGMLCSNRIRIKFSFQFGLSQLPLLDIVVTFKDEVERDEYKSYCVEVYATNNYFGALLRSRGADAQASMTPYELIKYKNSGKTSVAFVCCDDYIAKHARNYNRKNAYFNIFDTTPIRKVLETVADNYWQFADYFGQAIVPNKNIFLKYGWDKYNPKKNYIYVKEYANMINFCMNNLDEVKESFVHQTEEQSEKDAKNEGIPREVLVQRIVHWLDDNVEKDDYSRFRLGRATTQKLKFIHYNEWTTKIPLPIELYREKEDYVKYNDQNNDRRMYDGIYLGAVYLVKYKNRGEIPFNMQDTPTLPDGRYLAFEFFQNGYKYHTLPREFGPSQPYRSVLVDEIPDDLLQETLKAIENGEYEKDDLNESFVHQTQEASEELIKSSIKDSEEMYKDIEEFVKKYGYHPYTLFTEKAIDFKYCDELKHLDENPNALLVGERTEADKKPGTEIVKFLSGISLRRYVNPERFELWFGWRMGVVGKEESVELGSFRTTKDNIEQYEGYLKKYPDGATSKRYREILDRVRKSISLPNHWEDMDQELQQKIWWYCKRIEAKNNVSESFVHQTEETTEQDTLDTHSLKNSVIYYKTYDKKPISEWLSANEMFKSDIPELIISNTYDEKSDTGILVFKEPVTRIGDNAFRLCKTLESITIPEGVKSIGSRAFYDCKSLTSITIPQSVTSIGYRAFGWCRSLKEIVIPEDVESIGNYAFCNCYELSSVIYKSKVHTRKYFILDALRNSEVELGDNIFYMANLP